MSATAQPNEPLRQRPASAAPPRRWVRPRSSAATPSAGTGWCREIGAEIAAPLTAALERIHALTTTGKIDRAGLRALRDEVEQARQVGMIGQQLTRFASGRVRQSHERLQLADVLNGVLAHRARETQARGISSSRR